jgi:hypothetical protein
MFPAHSPLLWGFLCICATAIQAQNEIPPLVEKPRSDVQITKEVKVRNLNAEVIAHWLDPARIPKSYWDEVSLRAWDSAGYDQSDAPRLEPPVAVELPTGVQVEFLREHNALRISGNAAGIEKLEKLIRQLDQPLRQIEVECQVVAVDKAALKATQWLWTPAGQTLSGATMQETKSAPRFHATLNEWVQSRQAEIITAPRAVAINGIATSLDSTTITTSGFKIYDGKQWVEFSLKDSTTTTQVLPNLIETLGLTVVPRVNADGSIKARIQMSRRYAVGFSKIKPIPVGKQQEKAANSPTGLIPPYGLKVNGWQPHFEPNATSHFLRHNEGFEREISIKDGATLAFTGFKTMDILPTSQSQQQARKFKGKDTVIFINMREIRRPEPLVPGT